MMLLMIVSNHLCNNEGSNPLTHCVRMIRSQLIKDISAFNLVDTYDDNLSPDLVKGNVMLLCSRKISRLVKVSPSTNKNQLYFYILKCTTISA